MWRELDDYSEEQIVMWEDSKVSVYDLDRPRLMSRNECPQRKTSTKVKTSVMTSFLLLVQDLDLNSTKLVDN